MNILIKCREYNTLTLGKFDVTLLPLQQFWQKQQMNGFDSNQVRTDELTNILDKTGMKHIIMNPDNYSVKFDRSGINIDLGGFGKGYALDRIKARLIGIEISDVFISFGDSSILALGNHPHGQGWKSGINHLFKPGESLFVFDLMNESLSTSGTGPGKSRDHLTGHILHPVRGFLEPGFLHVSVTSELAVDADSGTVDLLHGEPHREISRGMVIVVLAKHQAHA